MALTRRGFIGACVAAAVAPTLARLEKAGDALAAPPSRSLPFLYGDGVHDDTAALQALLDRGGCVTIPPGMYRTTDRLIIRRPAEIFMGGVEIRNSGTGGCLFFIPLGKPNIMVEATFHA